MHYFHNLSSASGGFTPGPDFHPWTPQGDFLFGPLICPPREKILRAPMSVLGQFSKPDLSWKWQTAISGDAHVQDIHSASHGVLYPGMVTLPGRFKNCLDKFWQRHGHYKKLIRRWDSERKLSLRRLRARTTKYNRLVHKFRHRSTRLGLCVGTHVYQIQWNNAI